METTIVYRGYVGIMENKMETTIVYRGQNLRHWLQKLLQLCHRGFRLQVEDQAPRLRGRYDDVSTEIIDLQDVV